jgi:hypothetical protein
MERIKPYVYDPSQQIRKDLGDAATSVEQGFQNILDKKKQEYDFVNKVYEDAELLKKDLNLHNYELITKRSNDLIKETASVIKEKGKIDFTKLGELKNKVREIADAKKNSELSVQAVGDITKMVQANAANMRNPIDTLTKMMAKLRDEKYLFSPRNMYETAMEDYKNGLDYTKIIQDKLLELQKKGVPVQGQFDAPDGSLIEYKGIVPFGYQINETTKKLEPKIEVDPKTGVTTNTLDEISRTIDPELWKGYMKQVVGFGQMLNPNSDDYAKDLINSTLGGSISYTVKEDALKRNTARTNAKLKEVQLDNALYEASPQQRALDRQKNELEITYKKASIGNMAADNSLAQQRLQQDKAEFAYKKEQDAIGGVSTGKSGEIKLNTPNSFLSNTKYGDKEIKGVGNSQTKGIVLVPKSGKNIVLDTQDKINDYYNNVDKETRLAIDKIMSSPQYKPVQGQSKSSAPVQSNKFTKFSDPKLVR